MNFIKAVIFVLTCIAAIELTSDAVVTTYNAAGYPIKTESVNSNNISIYNTDLKRVEKFLFGKTYTSDNLETRLCRVEKNLFSKTFSTLTTAKRMNNILANYRDDYNAGERYYAGNNYYGANKYNTLRNRLRNNLIGQPTGFTPSITSPYVNTFGPSYYRGYYGNNGWRYHNTYRPTMTGAGIHILD